MSQTNLRGEKAYLVPPESGTSQHHTLALELVLHNLQRQERPRVLDLGRAIGANVSFLTHYSCKLFIADLFQTLRGHRDGLDWDAMVLDRTLAEHLPYRDQSCFDLIFAWDLLNYLDRQELEVLGRHLSRLCKRSGLLFAMLSTRKQIPDRPTDFRILDLETLAYDNPSKMRRPCPLYKEPDLARLMSDFEVETSFLLRNGMQEYVLALRPS
ncbi:MAG: class I SAM-dependent methyltransferase [Thermoanaerobaculia bacterium]